MQAVILCPQLPEINGRPVVHLQLAWFSGHGVKEVIFIGDTSRLGDGSEWGMRFVHSKTALEAIPHLHPTFFLMAGSTYVPVDCEDSWREFRITPDPVLEIVLTNQGQEPRFLVMKKDVFVSAASGSSALSLSSCVHSAASVGKYRLTNERYFETDSSEGRQLLLQHIRDS